MQYMTVQNSIVDLEKKTSEPIIRQNVDTQTSLISKSPAVISSEVANSTNMSRESGFGGAGKENSFNYSSFELPNAEVIKLPIYYTTAHLLYFYV